MPRNIWEKSVRQHVFWCENPQLGCGVTNSTSIRIRVIQIVCVKKRSFEIIFKKQLYKLIALFYRFVYFSFRNINQKSFEVLILVFTATIKI